MFVSSRFFAPRINDFIASKKCGWLARTNRRIRSLVPGAPPPDESLDQLAAAMEELDRLDPAAAQLIDLHVFSGLSLVEIAGLRGSSERTLQREWRKARLLLRHLMAPRD